MKPPLSGSQFFCATSPLLNGHYPILRRKVMQRWEQIRKQMQKKQQRKMEGAMA